MMKIQFNTAFPALLFAVIMLFGCEKEKNTSPTCNIVTPTENDSIQRGDIIKISAEADDADGNVYELRFYSNENGIGSAYSFPYDFLWDTSDEQLGEHIIRVTAKDNEGASTSDERRIYIFGEPTVANAGPDQVVTDNTKSVQLSGNEPKENHGKGVWSIISGDGGSFENDTVYNTTFTGEFCSSYILRWEIKTVLSSTFDDVSIVFDNTPTTAMAGADQIFNDETISTILDANVPSSGKGRWSIVKGEGGVIVDESSPNSEFKGNMYEVYLLRWTISNECGKSSSDEVAVKFVKDGKGKDVVDLDGNVYKTIYVGNRFWMTENLKTTHYNDGTEIPIVTNGTTWSNLTTGAMGWFNNDELTYKDTYGALYNWYTVETDKLCPSGWHVPSHEEWYLLENYISEQGFNGSEAVALKAKDGWYNNGNGTDDFNFSALPCGDRQRSNGIYKNDKRYGYWWTSTESSQNIAYSRTFSFEATHIYGYGDYKRYGFSVRCVKD